jgi:hypothetical protein
MRVRENDALPEIIRYLSNNLFAFNPGALLLLGAYYYYEKVRVYLWEKVRKAEVDVADDLEIFLPYHIFILNICEN